MPRFSLQNILLAAVLALTSQYGRAQKVKEPKTTAEWTARYQPFRIAGNLYYVGTYDLACYLITTPQGIYLSTQGLRRLKHK